MDTSLPITPRIAARLQRLGQRVRLNGLGHRRLSEEDTRRLTTALLRDIDETILPRHVRVTTNAGQSFSLDITGRRLLRLVAAGSGGTVGKPDDPAEAVKTLASELKRGLLRATEVTLQSYAMDSAQDRSDVGCSATALAGALGLDLEALEGESTADKALRCLGRHARAVVVTNRRGHVLQTLGDADDVARLTGLTDALLQDMLGVMSRTLGRGSRSGCMSFGTDNESGANLICAISDRTRFLAFVENRRMDGLLPVLQDIFAQ